MTWPSAEDSPAPICYKGCKHTRDTQFSKPRYITAFHFFLPFPFKTKRMRREGRGLFDYPPWPNPDPVKGPHQLPTGAPPATPHCNPARYPCTEEATESPQARPAYPAAPRLRRKTASSTTITGTPSYSAPARMSSVMVRHPNFLRTA